MHSQALANAPAFCMKLSSVHVRPDRKYSEGQRAEEEAAEGVGREVGAGTEGGR